MKGLIALSNEGQTVVLPQNTFQQQLQIMGPPNGLEEKGTSVSSILAILLFILILVAIFKKTLKNKLHK